MSTDMNLVVLRGHLSSDPKQQVLDSGTLLVKYEVTVRHDGAPTDSVLVTWFRPEGRPPPVLVAGAEVVVCGRVRRRFWQAPGGVRASSTEVQADSVRLSTTRNVAAAKRALESAIG